jgi:hypothetical protein
LSTVKGVWTLQHNFDGERIKVKEQAADFALQLVCDYFQEKLGDPR